MGELKLSPEAIEAIKAKALPRIFDIVEGELGISIERTSMYYQDSLTQHPEYTAEQTREDTAHKYIHAWRMGQDGLQRLGEGAVGLWDIVNPLIYAVVDEVIAAAS